MDSKIRPQSPYSGNNRRGPGQPSEKHAPDDRLDIGEALIVISLLSLGFWAAIREAVVSLASTVLG